MLVPAQTAHSSASPATWLKQCSILSFTTSCNNKKSKLSMTTSCVYLNITSKDCQRRGSSRVPLGCCSHQKNYVIEFIKIIGKFCKIYLFENDLKKNQHRAHSPIIKLRQFDLLAKLKRFCSNLGRIEGRGGNFIPQVDHADQEVQL